MASTAPWCSRRLITTNARQLSDFGNASIALDNDFTELERLSQEIDKISIESDSGLERAKKLLGHFGETGERIGTGVQAMAKALEEARARAEKAAEKVARRAAEIQQRQQSADRLSERFQTLAEMVKKISVAMSQMQKPAGQSLSPEEKAMITQHLPELESKLGMLVDEAQKLRADAEAAQLKTLMKNADAMAQSLNAARSRLSVFVERH